MKDAERWILYPGLIALAGFAAVRQDEPALEDARFRALVAESLTIRDTNGTDRAVLGIGELGSPRLRLMNEKGEARADLALGRAGDPLLGFADESGKARVELSVRGDFGSPGLRIAGTDGRPKAMLGLNERDEPHLTLSRGPGAPGVSVQTTDEGANVSVSDGAGKVRLALFVRKSRATDSEFTASVVVFDDKGDVLWSPK